MFCLHTYTLMIQMLFWWSFVPEKVQGLKYQIL